MKCDLCQGEYREKLVTTSFRRKGVAVVVEDIPAKVCDRCGDTLISESVIKQIEDMIEGKPQHTAPLYRFPHKISPRA